jgi:anti-sigma-K factor RskA
VTCAQFRESAWAYALGALEPEEKRELERHLSEAVAHEGCHAALDRAFSATAALSAAIPPIQPPPAAWDSIQSRLSASGMRAPARVRGRAPWLVAFAAAAACLLAVAQSLTYRRTIVEKNAQLAQLGAAELERQACARELQALKSSVEMQRAALAMLELPATQVVPLGAPPGTHTASRGSALFNPEQQKAVVLISALAPAAGKDYELWVIRAGRPTPAGVFKPGLDGRVITQVDPKILQAGLPEIFAVTLEPEGGSPAPTTAPFLLGRVQKS